MKKNLLIIAVLLAFTGISAQKISNDDVRYDQYGKKVDRTLLSAENRNGVLVFESAD
ncbi:MAG: hypothetical protein Q7U47_03240 [Paludibacter sp.]|nr:hypothetical protein [Paludibacter sp.]